MLLSEFDYELPDELIAQKPLAERDASRMLVIERESADFRDAHFRALPENLRAGDLLVLNNTKVFPARLVGRRETSGGRVELFLLRVISNEDRIVWLTLARPARRLPRGARVLFDESASDKNSINQVSKRNSSETILRGEVLDVLANGQRIVRFECAGDFDETLNRLGRTPLPPYIKRASENLEGDDRARYQTVYAKKRGAIAAPTAGLHFSARIFEALAARGVRTAELTLHVGYGTFEPVRSEDLSAHRVAPEFYEISEETAHLINETRRSGGRIVAVGTTVTRALEAATDEAGITRATAGETDLTITPGYRFRAVDALLTNFHLPRSSLLVLVAAFAGRDLTLRAYRHAVAARYRFYSYGDCMLIL
jgi:S-adenosylmethionine:tRNA ribosyltransferase-isomerase